MSSALAPTLPVAEELEVALPKKQIVSPPIPLGNDFEVAVVRPPRALLSDLAPIFPALKKADARRLLVVPTVQRAQCDLAGIGHDVEAEKDRLLKTFQVCPFCCCRTAPPSFASQNVACPTHGSAQPTLLSHQHVFMPFVCMLLWRSFCQQQGLGGCGEQASH